MAGIILLQAGGRSPQGLARAVQGVQEQCAVSHVKSHFLGACAVTQQGRVREGICHPLRCGKGREGVGSHEEPAT